MTALHNLNLQITKLFRHGTTIYHQIAGRRQVEISMISAVLCRKNNSWACKAKAQISTCSLSSNLIEVDFKKIVHSKSGMSHFYSTTATTNLDNLSSENLIEAWFNEVKAFGTVSVQDIPFDVYIQALDPVDYPVLNKLIVKTFYNNNVVGNRDETAPLLGRKLCELGKLCDMKVHVREGGEKVEVSCDVPSGVHLPILCVITVPVKFDVEVKDRGNGSVTISKLESEHVSVHLKSGSCHLHDMKTGSVIVHCDEGHVSCTKQLLGTIQLQCGRKGSISGDRLQGVSIHCATESGDINIKSLYSETAAFSSQSGNVHIRDCHGNVTVKTAHGNVIVDCLDGKLSAELESGSADVFLARQNGVTIYTSQGDITLRFPEDSACSLGLSTQVIEQDKSLETTLDSQGKGFLKSETETAVMAVAPQGKISLNTQDWLSSLKLQHGNTTS